VSITQGLVERLSHRLSLTASAPPVDGMRRAAVAAVLHENPTGVHVLMMKRAERANDPWSGHISLPGGGYQTEDPHLLATAIRETHEELGIRLSEDQLLGNLAPLAPRSAGPSIIEVTPFVFRVEHYPETICGPEALSAFWLPLDAASSGSLDSMYTYPNTTLTFPSWNYEGHEIWGLTRRIIDDLLATARGA
jgi:8-oxo-dGTP pyrophosphatase MutT (NUDIX family)